MAYKPPFTISADAIKMIAEISALIDRMEQATSLRLRKAYLTSFSALNSDTARGNISCRKKNGTSAKSRNYVATPIRDISADVSESFTVVLHESSE